MDESSYIANSVQCYLVLRELGDGTRKGRIVRNDSTGFFEQGFHGAA